jgi:hypothetical protein
MGKYGDTAIEAVELYTTGQARTPEEAWDKATAKHFDSPASREKSCPKGAFLGLCSAGYVKGIPRGDYTTSHDNRRYAANAAVILRRDTGGSRRPLDLWKQACGVEDKAHNQQMDVVLALWQQGVLT